MTAEITLRAGPREVCWRFGPPPEFVVPTGAFGRVHARLTPSTATIHAGSKRAKVGPIVASFGEAYRPRGCTPVPGSVVNAIASAPADYYVALNDARYAYVALRGQL